MAKGSNNIRGKSSDASKPYDVSNSFVKRVASRVTELLPQPSTWLSRWMSPSDVGLSNANEFMGHSLSSTITSRPPATSRAELNLVDNVDHLAPAAKKPRTNRYNSPVNQKFLRNDQYSAEDISPIAVRGGEPVAGPSSRDTRPELIASTPAVAAKVNGDDCSETSESTSGCSSLVPQAQSSTRSLGGSRFGRSIPGSSMDALDRRRPSFSTTTFNSPLRASMRARLGSSPFYSGRTMYGGSSQACDYARLVETSQRRASLVRRVGPTVRPPPSQESSLPLSSTAKRILDALEQFSTPMIDAKKMPVVGSKRTFNSMMSDQQQRRYAELNIPSTPDLLRVKRRERLQQSTLDARQTAAQTTPAPAPALALAPVPADIPAEYAIRKEEANRKKQTGKVKTKEKLEEEETVAVVKLPPAVLTMENLPKIDIAIPPPPAASVVTRQPAAGNKFVFSQPTVVTSVVTPVSVPTSTFKFSEPLGGITSNSSIRASDSDKHIVSSAFLKSRTSIDEVAGDFKRQFEENKNKTVDVEEVSTDTTPSVGSSVDFKNSSSGSKHLEGLADKTVSTTQKWECSKCKNNNSSSLEVCRACQADKSSKTHDTSKNNIKPPISSGFDNFYKKPVGTWECSTCLIQNKGEATKCVACESSRPVPKEKTAKKDSVIGEKPVEIPQTPSGTSQPGTGFGNLFKKPSGSWTCDVCMITNNADKDKCAACETAKPGATVPKATEPAKTASLETKQTGSGFGNLFKKPSGSWTCDVCMINNDADKVKCAACETPKPGATIPKATETSGPKFSFGIPSAVSTSGATVGATFSFGIPKGDQTSSTLNTTLSVPKSTSSDSAQTPTPTFSFGIPKPAATENNAVTSSTSAKSSIQFGSSSAQGNSQETDPAKASTPGTSNIFNFAKKSTPETIKPTEAKKLAFNVSTSAPNANTKPATSVFGVNSENSSSEQEKTGSAQPLFAFGSGKVTPKEVKPSSDSSSTAKPPQPTFAFGTKQEGFGSNLPSSTTNTLSSSSPSNVFKFGDTKTVSSGSGATSISSVSTQASAMTPRPNNMFSFGSNAEKKPITFGVPAAKETTPAPLGATPGAENKPIFGAFGTTSNTPSTFGSVNTFGSSTLGNKEQQTPFTTQPTTNAFGATTNTSTSTFATFGQANAFQPPQQENKASPVFAFGASAPQKESAPSGGFVFNPNPKMFSSNQPQQNTPGQMFNFNNTTAAPAPSSSFNFEPKFGSPAPGISPFNATASAPTPVFGAQTAQQPSVFGEQVTATPMFNFGSQSAQQPQTSANPVFEFGSNQQQNAAVAPAAAPTFMFGSTPAAPAPANPPAFDPNIKPTFNFTQGTATPVFSAIPTVNAASPAQPQNRKIRKAVRRTNISSVRN